MNNELHKEMIDSIRKLFEELASDNEVFAHGDHAKDYHTGKAQAYRVCADRMQKYLELVGEL